jgi:cupin 2 domain-containing protein
MPAAWRRGRLAPATTAPAEGEREAVLVDEGTLRVHHILSGLQAAPTQFLQPEDELALVIEGGAELEVAGEQVELGAGDWLWLPAGTPHELVSTMPGTSWLTVTGGRPPVFSQPSGTRGQR